MKRKILAAILTMSMMVSLMPTMAFAQEAAETTVDATAAADTTATEPQAEPENNGGHVARVGNQEYPTLQAAIDAAKSGETIVLLKDVAENISISNDKSLTIEGPATITGHISNMGNLTLNNLKVTSSDTKSATINNEDGNLVISKDSIIENTGNYNAIQTKGGSIVSAGTIQATSGKSNHGISANGTAITINGGLVQGSPEGVSAGIALFNRNYANDGQGNAPSICVINGGKIEGCAYAITGNNQKSGGDPGCSLTVNKGELVANSAIYWPNNGTVTIGKENGNNADVSITGKDGTGIEAICGTLTINSGIITGQGAFTETNDTLLTNYAKYSGCGNCGDALTVVKNRAVAYAANPLHVTINGGELKASNNNYGLRLFDCANWQPEGKKASGQNFSIVVNGGLIAGLEASRSNEKDFISGGYFTTDPSAYVVDKKTVVESDKAGYHYMVADKEKTAAEVVPEKPSVDVSENISKDDQAIAKEISEKITDNVVTNDVVNAAAKTVANDNMVTVDAGKAALEKAGISVESADVTIVVQPYMDIDIKAIDSTGSFTVGITPMYKTIATTAADVAKPDSIKLDGSGKNAVVIGQAHSLNITKPVTVTLPLPAGFPADNLFVKHTKDGRFVAYHKASVAKQTLTFTNDKGFSDFTVLADARKATVKFNDAIEDYTPAEVGAALPTPANIPAGQRFGGWTFEGISGTYTTLTDDLLTQLSGKGTVTAKAYFYTPDSGATSYAIVVADSDHGTLTVSRDHAYRGNVVTVTAKPDKDYVVDQVTVTDKNGDAITLTDKGDGQYTFKMPASKVDVKATFKKAEACDGGTACPSYQLKDVDKNAWYHGAVDYVVQQGLMGGTSATTFEPNTKTSRAMIVTILYRLENEPDVTVDNGFADVKKGQWYSDAISWAAANDIVNGYSDTQFGPNDSITREQMAAILYNYINYKGYDATASTDLDQYVDASQTSDWALESLKWANATGLITGTSDVTIAPKGDATRAQVAAMLMRFCETVEK